MRSTLNEMSVLTSDQPKKEEPRRKATPYSSRDITSSTRGDLISKKSVIASKRRPVPIGAWKRPYSSGVNDGSKSDVLNHDLPVLGATVEAFDESSPRDRAERGMLGDPDFVIPCILSVGYSAGILDVSMNTGCGCNSSSGGSGGESGITFERASEKPPLVACLGIGI